MLENWLPIDDHDQNLKWKYEAALVKRQNAFWKMQQLKLIQRRKEHRAKTNK